MFLPKIRNDLLKFNNNRQIKIKMNKEEKSGIHKRKQPSQPSQHTEREERPSDNSPRNPSKEFQSHSSRSDKSEIFEQIDTVLAGNSQNVSRKEILLKLKVDELERFCDDLAADNRRLTDKLQQLLEQRQNKVSQTTFVDEFSELNSQFGQIEGLLREYRTALTQYQQKVKEQMKVKDKQIEELKEQLSAVAEEDFGLKDKCFQLQKKNKEYEYRIDSLQKEIKIIESRASFNYNTEAKPQQSRFSKSSRDYRMYEEPNGFQSFNESVEQELEILIEKLVNQLQHERAVKSRMEEQIKRVTKELYNSQQEIKQKNNQIYSLELNVIKQEKAQQQQYGKNSRITAKNEYSQHAVMKEEKGWQRISGASQNMKSFSFTELLSRDVCLTNNQKMLLFQKIVEYYSGKMQKGLCSEIKPEQIIIFNYNSQHLNLLSIRESTSLSRERRQHPKQLKKQEVLWSLGLTLMKLLNEVPDQNRTTHSYANTKHNLNILLEEILESKTQQCHSWNEAIQQLNRCLDDYFQNFHKD